MLYEFDNIYRNNNLLIVYIDGLVQERRNPIANVLELHHSCTDPSILQHIDYELMVLFYMTTKH